MNNLKKTMYNNVYGISNKCSKEIQFNGKKNIY